MEKSYLYFLVPALIAFFLGRYSNRKSKDSPNYYLFTINQKLETMAETFEDFKAKLIAQGQTINGIKTSVASIATNVEGVKKDVVYLKDLAASNPGGFTAEQVADLSSVLAQTDESLVGVGASVEEVQASTAELDAETDSETGNQEEQA